MEKENLEKLNLITQSDIVYENAIGIPKVYNSFINESNKDNFLVFLHDDILLEEEAADLAYYLGFCLTVASLAISFISDMSLATSSNGNSKLIRGSLAQFGAGLMATLIGLIAKIYIDHLKSNLPVHTSGFNMDTCP